MATGNKSANNKKNTANTGIEQTEGFDKEYYDWISELSSRYRQSQIKAAVRVNSEMLRFYWSVGKDIEERQFDNRYGSHFYENLSRDLSSALNNRKYELSQQPLPEELQGKLPTESEIENGLNMITKKK